MGYDSISGGPLLPSTIVKHILPLNPRFWYEGPQVKLTLLVKAGFPIDAALLGKSGSVDLFNDTFSIILENSVFCFFLDKIVFMDKSWARTPINKVKKQDDWQADDFSSNCKLAELTGTDLIYVIIQSALNMKWRTAICKVYFTLIIL